VSAGTAFTFGWTTRRDVEAVANLARMRRLAETRFAMHVDPMRAAKATVSLRNAYPWLSAPVAAQMGAFGVDPTDPATAEVAGLELARRARRGYIDTGRRRNTREVRNVRATPLWAAMGRYAQANAPTTAADLGIPTGTDQDYLSTLNIGPEPMTPALAHNLTGGQRPFAQRLPERAAEFGANAATFDTARRMVDDPGFFQRQTEPTAPTSNLGGFGASSALLGDTLADSGQSVDQSRTQGLPGANIPAAQQIADSLPAMDATLRHIRHGGLTVDGIPIPSGDTDASSLSDVLLGPDRNEIGDRLQAEADRIDAMGVDPENMAPTLRSRREGITAALDLIAGDRQSVGPDVALGGYDFNLGDITDRVGQGARGTVRAATQTMDSLWQVGQASFRRLVEDPSEIYTPAPIWTEQGQEQIRGPAGETDLGIALENLANGRALQQGGGYFVDPGSPDAQLRRRRELTHGDIGGHVITMGRWTADQIPGVEPDDTAFNVVSGLVDLTWAIVDPGGALIDTAARSPRTAAALARAGGFTATRSVHADRFAEFLASADGQRVLNFYADLDPDDALAIERSRTQSMPEWAHWELADGNVGDIAYVEEMLRNVTGMGIDSPRVPTARAAGTQPAVQWRRRFNQSRLASEVPETGARAAPIHDAQATVDAARASMRNMRVPEPEIARIVGRIWREGYETPSRVRVQQIERELADLEASGLADDALVPGMEGVTVADRYTELEDTLAELRPGLFISRPTPRRNVLADIWFNDMQAVKRQTLVDHGVGGLEADRLTALHEIGRQIDGELARQMSEDGAYWLRLTGEDQPVNRRVFGMVDGEHIGDASTPGFAHMAAEHLSAYLPLEDDYRQLARLTQSPVVKWLNTHSIARANGSPRSHAALADSFMDKVWKPSRLLRLAWPIRVVGEEQFRLAASGFDSAVNHPLSYVAMVMGTREEGKLNRLLNAVPGERGAAMTTDLTGTPWGAVSEFQDAMNRQVRNWLIPGGQASGGRFEPFAYRSRGGNFDPGFHGAWADLLARAHSDDLVRRIARIHLGTDSEFSTLDELIEAGGMPVGSVDDLRIAAEQSVIARTRADLMDSHTVLGNRGRTGWVARVESGGDEAVQSWDDYVDSLQYRLMEFTGGHDDLVQAVATGRLGDVALDTPNSTRVNKAAVRRLERGYGDVAPEVIAGDRTFLDRAMGDTSRINNATDGYDRAMERMYASLGAIPTDRLSRSPAFRQFYYRRVQELMPFASESAQARILKAADLAKVPDDEFHLRMSAWIDDTDSTVAPTQATLSRAASRGTGDLTFDMVDDLAKSAALDNTRWLLYDVHKRGQFMDALRIVFPFGEAWKEVATRWLALTAKRPGTVISRSHQVLRTLGHGQDWEDVTEDPSQHGFMFENSTGESVFTYPAAEWFTSALTGVPVELTGSLNGLTLMNSVLPGIGPVLQVPLSFSTRLRESPEFDGWRELVFPFGMPDLQALPAETLFSPGVRRFLEGMAGAQAPGGRQTGLDGLRGPDTGIVGEAASGVAQVLLMGRDPSQDRLFMNSMFDVMRYNVSTGGYSTDSTPHINRLIRESTAQAAALYMVRGVVQFAAPSAPIPEFQVEDQDGSLLMLRALTDIYRGMQDEDYSTAPQRFLEAYGDNMALVMQAKTVPRTSLLPVTSTADRWLRANRGVEADYPLTYGLYAPGNNDPDAEFDFDAYERGIRGGQLDTLGRELDAKDLVRLANDRVGSLEYRRIEAELLATPGYTTESGNLTEQGQRYLSTEVTPALRASYPGFGADDLHRGVSTDDLREAGMDEAREASRDRRIDAPLRGAMADYLGIHDEVLAAAREDYESTSYYESLSTRPLRDYMRFTVAPAIRDDLPEAYRPRWDAIWERLFDRVMLAPWAEADATDDERLPVAA
jgi:hypothetical protein